MTVAQMDDLGANSQNVPMAPIQGTSILQAALIFLHIPKTGGVTLRSLIERRFPAGAVYSIRGPDILASIDAFKKLPLHERREIGCLTGHMHFGLHEYLPRPSTYITFLRDPVDRAISHYYFVRRTAMHHLHERVVSAGMSLGDYIESGLPTELFNGQTILLSGITEIGSIGREPQNASSETLELAKRNLRNHFTFIGLRERFDESLFLLKEMFGWPSMLYRRQNVTAGRLRKDQIPSDTLQLIEAQNQLDLQLYDFAKQLFDAKVREMSPSLRRELQVFQFANRLYQRAANTATTASSTLRRTAGRGAGIVKGPRPALRFPSNSSVQTER